MVELSTRHTEADNRRFEDVAWREQVRTEDVAWREKVRAEEMAWRSEARAADRVERDAGTSQNIHCLARGLAVIAAAQNAKPGTPSEKLARMALDLTKWIGDFASTTDQGT
jgi:hypothetical protein